MCDHGVERKGRKVGTGSVGTEGMGGCDGR